LAWYVVKGSPTILIIDKEKRSGVMGFLNDFANTQLHPTFFMSFKGGIRRGH
jgi:hypothetical protein